MPNPQRQLFKLLAESRLRMQGIRSTHQDAIARIPARVESAQQELEQLRQQIRAEGIGSNRQLEQDYLTLLKEVQYLGQSYDMAPAHPKSTEIPASLTKAAEYAIMLLGIYGQGALIKGAKADLQRAAAPLLKSDSEAANALGKKLLGLRSHDDNSSSYS